MILSKIIILLECGAFRTKSVAEVNFLSLFVTEVLVCMVVSLDFADIIKSKLLAQIRDGSNLSHDQQLKDAFNLVILSNDGMAEWSITIVPEEKRRKRCCWRRSNTKRFNRFAIFNILSNGSIVGKFMFSHKCSANV